jgi:hypothetical protein
MGNLATNPQTGETLFYDGTTWAPAKIAENPQTGERMAWDGSAWQPLQRPADAVASAVGGAVRGAGDAAPIDPVDEATRVFSSANEKWIAPALGGLSDLVGNTLYAPINKLFGTDLKADLTGIVREGMRDVGASGGADYLPKTEVGQLASDVIGAVGASLPIMGGASTLATKVADPVARGVLTTLGSAPGQQIAGAAGAGAGAYAANEMAPGSVFAELAGMLGGAALGGGIAAKVAPNKVIDAFTRQNMPMTAGVVSPDTAMGNATRAAEAGGLGTTIMGSGIVRNAYDNVAKTAGEKMDDLARSLGTVRTEDDLGRTLQGSVGRFMDDKAAQADDAFTQIGRIFAPEDRFRATNTLRALASSYDDIDDPAIAALVRDPRFAAYRNAIAEAGDELSYSTLKGFRSYIGRQMDRLTLDGGADNAQLKALYGALTDDMESALRAKGGDAAVDAFRDVNNWYRQQMEMARNNLQPLVGKGQPASAERAFSTFTQSAGAKAGNIQRLQDIYRNLSPGERADVSASILSRMGQDASGFSVAKFLSDLSKMSPAARKLLFTDQFGDDLLRAWEDMTEIILPQADKISRYINRSNSGLSITQAGQVVVGAGAAEPFTAVATILGPAVMAKAMTSPGAVRFMAKAIARGEAAASIAARVTAILAGQQAGD